MRLLTAVPALLLCPVGLLLAQDAPILRTGNTEVGGFVGASYGIDKTRIMGGGNVAYALSRVVMPYGEFSYFPGIGRRSTVGDNFKFNFSVPLADMHGGVHLRVPIKESRIVPYGVLGVGVVRSFARTERVLVKDALGEFNIDVPIPAETDFAVNFGGGLRFYLSEMFGVRAEAKAYRPTGNYSDIFGKVEFGFFFQLK